MKIALFQVNFYSKTELSSVSFASLQLINVIKLPTLFYLIIVLLWRHLLPKTTQNN